MDIQGNSENSRTLAFRVSLPVLHANTLSAHRRHSRARSRWRRRPAEGCLVGSPRARESGLLEETRRRDRAKVEGMGEATVARPSTRATPSERRRVVRRASSDAAGTHAATTRASARRAHETTVSFVRRRSARRCPRSSRGVRARRLRSRRVFRGVERSRRVLRRRRHQRIFAPTSLPVSSRLLLFVSSRILSRADDASQTSSADRSRVARRSVNAVAAAAAASTAR